MTKLGLKKFMIWALLIGSVVLAGFIYWVVGPQKPESLKACLIAVEIAYFLVEGGFLLTVYRGIKPTLED